MTKKLTKKEQEKWNKILEELDEELPPIREDRHKFIYAGDNEGWFDLNNKYDPIQELENEIDGIVEDTTEEDEMREAEIELGAKMLNSLDGLQGKIIRMRFEEGLTFREIGEKLGKSKQLVHYHYKRAIKALGDKFDPVSLTDKE